MDAAGFWQVIEQARKGTDGDLDAFLDQLEETLEKLSPADILAFDQAFFELRRQAYHWDVWAAADLIGGGCSEDSFEDFRNGLIALGQERFEKALEDPDSLAELVVSGEEDRLADTLFFREFSEIAAGVYETKAGRSLPVPSAADPEEPAGLEWREEDLPSRLPRLAEIYDFE